MECDVLKIELRINPVKKSLIVTGTMSFIFFKEKKV